MTYHTNHWGMYKTIWNDEDFDGKVSVYFDKNITDTDIVNDNNIKLKIKNPDWNNLILENVSFFSQDLFNDLLEEYETDLKEDLKVKELDKNSNEYIKMLEDLKKKSIKKSQTLKPEVIEWLNLNIKDKKNTNENTPLSKRKGWAIGNLEQNSKNTYSFTIMFYRQIDALKFIRKFSIFKEPVFYFDYFNGRERKNMDLNKILHILNKDLKQNGLEELTIDLSQLIGKKQGDTNLDPMTFSLKNWEREDEYDDIELSKEELEETILSLYSIDNENIKDIFYENNNLTKYDIYLK